MHARSATPRHAGATLHQHSGNVTGPHECLHDNRALRFPTRNAIESLKGNSSDHYDQHRKSLSCVHPVLAAASQCLCVLADRCHDRELGIRRVTSVYIEHDADASIWQIAGINCCSMPSASPAFRHFQSCLRRAE